MAHLIWTEPALSDLNDIAEYIALENPVAARKLVREVFSVVERLEKHPSSGRIPIELERWKVFVKSFMVHAVYSIDIPKIRFSFSTYA